VPLTSPGKGLLLPGGCAQGPGAEGQLRAGSAAGAAAGVCFCPSEQAGPRVVAVPGGAGPPTLGSAPVLGAAGRGAAGKVGHRCVHPQPPPKNHRSHSVSPRGLYWLHGLCLGTGVGGGGDPAPGRLGVGSPRRRGCGGVNGGCSGAGLAQRAAGGELMASLLQCYCQQGPAVGPGVLGVLGMGGSHVGGGPGPSALLLGDGGSCGTPASLLGVAGGQEQGRAGAGVPLLAHEGEDPAGRAGSAPAGTTPAPWGSGRCPHRFLVSGGMTASARRFL